MLVHDRNPQRLSAKLGQHARSTNTQVKRGRRAEQTPAARGVFHLNMQPPTKTLALLCLGAGTTTSFTFQTCGIHYERAAQSQSRGRSSGELQTRGWSRAGSSASSGSAVSSSYRARRRRSTHVSPAERPSSLLYCAPPTSGEEDNYVSTPCRVRTFVRSRHRAGEW